MSGVFFMSIHFCRYNLPSSYFDCIMATFAVFLLLVAVCSSDAQKAWADEEETPAYWYDLGQQEIKTALEHEELNTNVAKNVILFLGDGMGLASITAGRILKGQMQNRSGEETILAMDQFHHVGFSKTYSVDKQVADSASTATAYLCGVKTNYHQIGVSGKARLSDCASGKGNEVRSVLMDAFNAGKSTGIVTTAHIVHATPAGAYAHTPDRLWYADSDLPKDAVSDGCKDIAQQFIDQSDKITVAMGGGRQYFQKTDQDDVEYPSIKGKREDGQDLIAAWKDKYKNVDAHYVSNQHDFDAINPVTVDKVLGLFEPSHMQYEADRPYDGAGEPSIAEMTEKAIRILQKNTKGFFLLVEGGRIDLAHHVSNAYRALHDVVAFDDAIAKAVELTADSDTLILATADHSHTFSMGGYSDRGNPIFGLAPSNAVPDSGDDNKPYTTLLYANGPGYQGKTTSYEGPHQRDNITFAETGGIDYKQQSAVPLSYETHGGDDVAILTRGPMSHLFHGVHEQSYIAYVMRYATCTGMQSSRCNDAINEDFQNDVAVSDVYSDFLGLHLDVSSTEAALYSLFVLLLTLVVVSLLFIGLLARSKKSGGSEFKVNGVENVYMQPL